MRTTDKNRPVYTTKPLSKDVIITADSGGVSAGNVVSLTQQHIASALVATNVELYLRASEQSGGMVQVLPQYRFLPVLIGNDGQPVLLYHFIEEVEGIVEYEELQRVFPMLSYGQIASALAFLRKLAQFNAKGVDIDAEEERFLEADPDFQEQIAKALADTEVSRVLNAKQRNG